MEKQVKIYPPDAIKKYDIISAIVAGLRHPCIVYKTDEKFVYVIGLTSTKGNNVIYQIKNSRFFKDKYMTITVVKIDKKFALENFAGVFDCIPEAEKGFSKVKEFYKNLFNSKHYNSEQNKQEIVREDPPENETIRNQE